MVVSIHFHLCVHGLIPLRFVSLSGSKWLKAVEIDVPGNGSCYYYALHATRMRIRRGNSISVCKNHTGGARFFKREVNDMLNQTFDELVSMNSVLVPQLHERYFPGSVKPPHDEALANIHRHIISVSCISPGAQVGRHHWAGAEKIMATVLFIRDPVFAMDVRTDGMAFVQINFLDYQEMADGSLEETVRIVALQTPQATVIIRTFLNYDVIPIILTLHHHPGLVIRVKCSIVLEFYRKWNISTGPQDTMRNRRDIAQAVLGMPIVASEEELKGMLDHMHPQSRSVYEPSQSQSQSQGFVTADQQISPARQLDFDFTRDDSSQEITVSRGEASSSGLTANNEMEATGAAEQAADDARGELVEMSGGISQDSDFDQEATAAVAAKANKLRSVHHARYMELLQIASSDNSDGGDIRSIRVQVIVAKADAYEGWKRRHSRSRLEGL